MAESTQESMFVARLTFPGLSSSAAVTRIDAREALSRPFAWGLTIRSLPIEIDEARGGDVHLEMEDRWGAKRFVHGVVESIEMELAPRNRGFDELAFELRIVPRVYSLLRWRRGTRIFQDLSVPDIVKKILAESGSTEHTLWDLHEDYPARPYTVQYDETEWDFCCRLLEDEGIYFNFEHDAIDSIMAFQDRSELAPELEPKTVEHVEQPGEEPWFRAWRWSDRRRIRVAKVSLNDFDLQRPSTSLLTSVEADDAELREHYEFPAGYVDPERGARLAQIRLDEHRTERAQAKFMTNALPLPVGHRFDLTGHGTSDGEFLATTFHLSWAGGLPEIVVESMPSSQSFRPKRLTPKPRRVGLQTATITGPANQEIHTDELGRVKVQFHWDREGELDEKTSCWLRVTQPHTTGSILVPRIGWEVLVDHIDGDPDRPVCLGRVWNPSFPPPASLPGGMNLTRHSSQSSPGGAGTNDIIYDDTAGAERMDINACRDALVAAANNKTHSVGANAVHNVGGSRTSEVGGDESTTVGSDLNTTVSADRTITIGANRTTKGNCTFGEDTSADYALTVSGMWNAMVGNPVSAILEVIAAEAIATAQGAAAGAVQRASASLLGPIQPALDQASAAIGSAAQYAGPAAGLLAGGDPQMAMFGNAVGALAAAPGAAQVGATATGMANAAISGALAEAGNAAVQAALGPTAGAGGGSGKWDTTVGADVTEDIGGLAAINSARGITFAVAGDLDETVGAVRVEMIKGSKAETSSAAKAETVGVYKVEAAESIAVSAQAALALSISGSSKSNIGGGYSIAADGPVVVNAAQLKMKASTQITFTVGDTKLILKAGTVAVDGNSKLDVKGSSVIKLKENALG